MNTNKITITLSRPQSNAYPIDPAAHNHDVSDDAGYNPYGGILNPLPAIPAAGDRMEVGHITCVWKLNEDGTRPYGPPTFRQYHYMTWATVLIDQPRFRPDEQLGTVPPRQYDKQNVRCIDVLVQTDGGEKKYVSLYVRTAPVKSETEQFWGL